MSTFLIAQHLVVFYIGVIPRLLTWLCFEAYSLQNILLVDPTARVGLAYAEDSELTNADTNTKTYRSFDDLLALKNNQNEVIAS